MKTKRKNFFLFLSCILLILLSILFSLKKDNVGTTFIEAYRLASCEARKWNKKSVLFYGTSADNQELLDNDTGEYGKRRAWNFQFVIPNTDKSLTITIHDRKIYRIKEVNTQPISINKCIENNEININSDEAVRIATDNYNLLPGRNWAIGYHFIIFKEDGYSKLSVQGLDNNGYITQVEYDMSKRSLIKATHKVAIPGEIIKNNFKIKIDMDKPFAPTEIGISPQFDTDKFALLFYYANPFSADIEPSIMKSIDGGNSWVETGLHDNVKSIYFSDNYKNDKSLYIIADSCIYKSINELISWNPIFKSPGNDIISFYAINKFIAILKNENIEYSTDGGITWSIINSIEGAKEIFFDTDNKLYLCTERGIFVKHENKWDNISLFDGYINSFVISKNNIIMNNNDSIFVFNLKTLSTEIIPLENKVISLHSSVSYSDGLAFNILTDDNYLIHYEKEVIKSSWNKDVIDLNNYDNIIQVTSDSMKNTYIITQTTYKWENIKGVYK